MPFALRPRIFCFYCGSKSSHRKGDAVTSFQCQKCEGTNFLDAHGEITDVPHEPIATPTKTGTRRYAVPRQSSLSPEGPAESPADSIFCKKCLTNQHFLSELLANYLPDEDDPQYDKFEAAYPAYKKDLEKRYPPVCSRCEPRVRERLKKTSYAAKSDILARSLGKGNGHVTAYTAPFSQRSPGRTILILAELAWWLSIVVQAVWHLFGAREGLNYPGEGIEQPQGLQPGLAFQCIKDLVQGRRGHPPCNVGHAIGVKYALIVAATLFWWNPAILRLGNARVVNKLPFYALQSTVLMIRALAWWTLGRRQQLNPRTQQAAHALLLAILAMYALMTYRMIRLAPRKKVEFRSLDAPLIGPDAVQHPQEGPGFDGTPSKRSDSPFKIRNLKPRNEFDLSTTTGSSTRVPAMQHYQSTAPADADSMDWEPSHTQPTQPLRTRLRASESLPQPTPTTDQVRSNGFGPKTPSPFYGSLPPAPKSLEAKIRGAAQRQPPQFKPVSDNKQADWFKRMGLAQSQTSWTNKEYVRTVDQEDTRNYELAEGKLNLGTLGMKRTDGTGLEDLFGRTFRLEDDSPIKETPPEPHPMPNNVWRPIDMFAIAVPLALATGMAFTYFAPRHVWALGVWLQDATNWFQERIMTNNTI